MARVVLALLTLLLAFLPPAQAREPEATRFGQGLLWKVERKGAAPSYLFGTMHLDDDRILKLAPPVQRAFDASRRFAVELINDEAATRSFRRAMVTREPALPALLGEADYGALEPILIDHGIPRDARPRLRPWAALVTLLQPRGGPGIILDYVLLLEAQEKGKAVVALESVEEQIAAMDDLPEETQKALLRHAVARYADIQDAIPPMVDAYLARDLASLWRINDEVMEGDAAMQAHNARLIDSVLYARNRRFAERLAPELEQGGVFAAFGALHLYGEQGVPSLLSQRGFRVTRVY